MALESEPTVVPGIFLSDLSIVEQGTQKRSLIGCFDQLAFPQFPAQLMRFFVTSWITNVGGTLRSLELTARIQQSGSAHVVFSSSSKIEFPEDTMFERDNVIALSMPAVGVTFPVPGRYTVIVLLNGDEIGKREFNVLQVARPQE